MIPEPVFHHFYCDFNAGCLEASIWPGQLNVLEGTTASVVVRVVGSSTRRGGLVMVKFELAAQPT